MKAPDFVFHAPISVDGVLTLLAEHGDEAKVVAGGQSLIPLLGLRLAHPAHVVDLNRVAGLDAIAVHAPAQRDHPGPEGGWLEIGALVRHRAAERSPVVAAACPLLPEALAMVGHAAIRNRGTVCGSLAHGDPAAELPAVLVALGGEVIARSISGTRTIAADDLFEGYLTTSLRDDELVTAARFPVRRAREGTAFREFCRRSGDFAVLGVAARIQLDDGGRVASASLCFSGASSVPVASPEATASLVGQVPDADAIVAAANAAAAALDPPSDLHGSAAYRRQLARVLARDALIAATEHARETP